MFRRRCVVKIPRAGSQHTTTHDLKAVDPVPPADRARQPLFRGRAGHGPISHHELTLAVRRIVRAAGEAAAAPAFSGRSLRVGGATELAARGARAEEIQALGRSASDAYQAYTRVTQAQALRLSAAMGGRAARCDPTLEATFPGYRQA